MVGKGKRYSLSVNIFKQKGERLLSPFVSIDVQKPLFMKDVSKNSVYHGLSNPINRTIVLILITTFAIAICVVTVGLLIYLQW
jgi:hypothetical protein